jgi:DNA-binding response OmpR family regulator
MEKRILVLEDDKAILELMELTLESEGYFVIGINHYEPLEYIVEFGPDIILLDIRLSDGYGHLLCLDLKANPLTAKIPVILVSGANNLETIAKNSKANNYLSKPFNVDELLNVVKAYA